MAICPLAFGKGAKGASAIKGDRQGTKGTTRFTREVTRQVAERSPISLSQHAAAWARAKQRDEAAPHLGAHGDRDCHSWPNS